MTLLGVVDVLTDSQYAYHPRSLAIEAYFAGWRQATGGGRLMVPAVPGRRRSRVLARRLERSQGRGDHAR